MARTLVPRRSDRLTEEPFPCTKPEDAHEETEERPRSPSPASGPRERSLRAGRSPPVTGAGVRAGGAPARHSRSPGPCASRRGRAAPRGRRGPSRGGGPPDRPCRLHRGASGAPRTSPPRAEGHPRAAGLPGHGGRLPGPTRRTRDGPRPPGPRAGRARIPAGNLVARRRARSRPPARPALRPGRQPRWDGSLGCRRPAGRRGPAGDPARTPPAARSPRPHRRPGGSAPRPDGGCPASRRRRPVPARPWIERLPLPGGASRIAPPLGRPLPPDPVRPWRLRPHRSPGAGSIVPCAIIGSEEAAAPFDRRGWLADALHLPLLSMAPPMPLSGLLSWFPLPSRWSVRFGRSRRPSAAGTGRGRGRGRSGGGACPRRTTAHARRRPGRPPLGLPLGGAGRASARRGRSAGACAGPTPAP